MDGRSSGEAPVLSGVPQGTVLGPLMFLTYINDVTLDLTSEMKLFADDAPIFRPIKKGLQISTKGSQCSRNLVKKMEDDF